MHSKCFFWKRILNSSSQQFFFKGRVRKELLFSSLIVAVFYYYLVFSNKKKLKNRSADDVSLSEIGKFRLLLLFQLPLKIPGRKKIASIYRKSILQNSPFFIFRKKLESSSCFRLAAKKCQSQLFLHGEMGVRIITHRSKRPTSRERKNLKLNQGILVINGYYRKNQHQNRADS